MSELLDRITIEEGKCGGRPCIRGMRIRVIHILEMLAGGMTPAEILEDFSELELEDIQASLAYAARELGVYQQTRARLQRRALCSWRFGGEPVRACDSTGGCHD